MWCFIYTVASNFEFSVWISGYRRQNFLVESTKLEHDLPIITFLLEKETSSYKICRKKFNIFFKNFQKHFTV